MKDMRMPLISIIMATYNREGTLKRAIDSVLVQGYHDLELIIVDDGSTDNTHALLGQYKDPRIRIYSHHPNRGVTAAKNRGLDAINGDWFTFLDSDDEMLPEALATFEAVIKSNSKIDAITCNCIDSVTGHFSGRGFDSDQYLDEQQALNAKGEHWGLTKTTLLGTDRFNEELPGMEATLWSKINSRATRYYIHKALRIYHTEGDDRISTANRSRGNSYRTFRALVNETHYLRSLAQSNSTAFAKTCIKGVLIGIRNLDLSTAWRYAAKLVWILPNRWER